MASASSPSRTARLLTIAAIAVAIVVVITVVIIGLTTPVPPKPAASTSTASPTAAPSTPQPSITPTDTADDVFAGGLYVDQKTHAVAAEKRLEDEGNTADAALIRDISSQSTAIWLGDHLSIDQLKPLLSGYRADAEKLGKTLVFVTYAIPNRDCGGLSAGGLSESEYFAWNREIAKELSGSRAVVLVEPDSLAMLSNDACDGESDRRLRVLHKAVGILADAGLTLYLDGGGSNWVKPDVMAERLTTVGIADTRGFFTNVSNYYRVDQERSYAEKVSKLTGRSHYVIDVSRNGNGWQGHWCNPPGAALGQKPHVAAGTTHLDALLWVKHPGDSDGACNGAPKAGDWWESYALDLARNR